MPENTFNLNAFLLAGLTIFLFIIHAILHARESRTSNDFFFASSSLSKDRIAANLSATSTSLGTALLFLLFQTPVYGIFIFLIILVFLIGQFLFMKVASKNAVDSALYGSIFRLVDSRTKSRLLALFSNAVTVFTFFVLLLIEVLIGSSILSYFLPPNHITSLIIVGCIVTGVTAYVIIGGFRVVTYSDKWQFWFLFISASMTAIYLLFLGSDKSPPISFSSAFEVLWQFPEGSFWILGTFVLNVIVVNALLPICQGTSWQRFASSEDVENFVSGYQKAFFTQIVWAWLLFACVSAIFYSLTQSNESGLAALFSLIDTSSNLGHYLILPMLFAGLTAALVSTADSLMAALFLAIDDFFGSDAELEKRIKPAKLLSILMRRRILIAFVITVLIIGFYHVLITQAASFQATIVGLMFTSVGQTVLLFPPIFFALYYGDRREVNPHKAIIGITLSLFVLWGMAIVGIMTGIVIWNQVAPIAGLAVGMLIVWRSFSKKSK